MDVNSYPLSLEITHFLLIIQEDTNVTMKKIGSKRV